jgi:hypothetical protein
MLSSQAPTFLVWSVCVIERANLSLHCLALPPPLFVSRALHDIQVVWKMCSPLLHPHQQEYRQQAEEAIRTVNENNPYTEYQMKELAEQGSDPVSYIKVGCQSSKYSLQVSQA